MGPFRWLLSHSTFKVDVECQQNLDFLWLVPCLTAPQSFQYYLHMPRKYVFWAILAQFFLPYQEITFSLWLVTQTLRNKTLIISTSFVLCAWAEKSIKKIKEVRRTRTKNTCKFNFFVGKAHLWLVSNLEAWQSRTLVFSWNTNNWFKNLQDCDSAFFRTKWFWGHES